MARIYYMGVDGGGTHCRCRLVDGSGQVLGEGLAGSANVYGDLLGAWTNVLAAARQTVQAAGLPLETLGHTRVGLGLAGAVGRQLQDQVLALEHPFGAVYLLTDAHAAVLGAFAGEDGAVLILGTGSSGLLRRGSSFESLGGLGFPASDHGSGAWLGLRALRESLLAWEGLREGGRLTDQVMRSVGSTSAAIIRWQQQAGPRDFASLAPLVFSAWDAGDLLAGELLRCTADEAEAMVHRLYQKGAHRCVLMGGLSAAILPLLGPDTQRQLSTPVGDALDGAVLMARRGIGRRG